MSEFLESGAQPGDGPARHRADSYRIIRRLAVAAGVLSVAVTTAAACDAMAYADRLAVAIEKTGPSAAGQSFRFEISGPAPASIADADTPPIIGHFDCVPGTAVAGIRPDNPGSPAAGILDDINRQQPYVCDTAGRLAGGAAQQLAHAAGIVHLVSAD